MHFVKKKLKALKRVIASLNIKIVNFLLYNSAFIRSEVKYFLPVNLPKSFQITELFMDFRKCKCPLT